MVKKLETLDQVTRFLIRNRFRNLPLPDPDSIEESILPRHTRLEIYREPGRFGQKIITLDDPNVVGAIGSAFENGNIPEADIHYLKNVARRVAKELSNYGDKLILVTGACPDNSFPSIVANELKKANSNIPIFGISPWSSHEAAVRQGDGDYSHIRDIHDAIMYLGYDLICEPHSLHMGHNSTTERGLKYSPRDIINIMIADGIISGRGSTGTNHELGASYETGKIVGLLKGTKGVTDEQPRVISATAQDGKKHFVTFYESDHGYLVRKLMAQIEVDHYLRDYVNLLEKGDIVEPWMSTLDIYSHKSSKRGKEPALNAWKVQTRTDEANLGWRKTKDRRKWSTWYNRQDMVPAGKLLLNLDRSSIVDYIQDNLGQKVAMYQPKTGEVGIFLFPAQTKVQREVVDTLEKMANQPETVYATINAPRLVA